MCIYMRPAHAGGHRLLVVDSLESNQLRFIHRKIKPGVAHPYVPMSIVGRLNIYKRGEIEEWSEGYLASAACAL